MTERFAYIAFLAVVGIGLALMTAALAAIWFFLLRQNRRARSRNLTTETPTK
jgi:cbb3-type cytochrome oxidase subunit 3